MYKDFKQKKKDLFKVYDRKISIYIRKKIYIRGRESSYEDTILVSLFSRVLDMYAEEFYRAFNAGFKDTLIFEVRYFDRLEMLRDEALRKNIIIKFNEKDYELIKADFMNDSKEIILLKVNRVS